MANKAKKDNKNIIIGVCAAVIVAIVVIVAAVLSINSKQTLNDAYFVSDDTKYVLTLETGDSEDETAPSKTHIVYFYSGDDITGAKTYYEFADASTAKAAYETIKDSLTDANSASIDGKYIIIVSDESEYADITASEVKQQIELMETLKNLDYDEEELDVTDEE